jgi:hypothetical protein
MQELPHVLADPCVAGIGVAVHQDGVAGGVGLDIGEHLIHVRDAVGEVGRRGAGLGVQIIDVEIDAFGQADADQRESLRGQRVRIGAVGPGDAVEIVERKAAERIEAVADARGARGRVR